MQNTTETTSYTFQTEDQVLQAGLNIEERRYWAEVKSTAQNALDEAKENESDVDDELWQTVDGHSWIIYTRYHLVILRHTSNDDAWEEFGELKAENAIQTMAFFAFLADCREALRELQDEQAEEAEEDTEA